MRNSLTGWLAAGLAMLLLVSLNACGTGESRGARFNDGDMPYGTGRDEALIDVGGGIYDGCESSPALCIWEDARIRGVDFRALGNEPGWYLEIFDFEKVALVLNYGKERYEFAAPDPGGVQVSGFTTYDLRNDAHRLFVKLKSLHCQDSMSGEGFETTVELIFDGRPFSGCGKVPH